MTQTLETENAKRPVSDLKRYLTPREAATYLGIGHSTLSIHRMDGTGPAYIRWGRMNIRYDKKSLEDWMAAHTIVPTPKDPATADKRRVGRPRKAIGLEGR